ncbi:hypothetical protein [Hydrogenoanaerobacterium sp.]|nr:hypothetical protein [Hydrogenoanaerobacterium sp.]
MPDYEKMYHVLFNKVSHVIEELRSVQRVTEEVYIGTDTQTEENEGG